MKKRVRLCIISPLYNKESESIASQITGCTKKGKLARIIPLRIALFITSFILTGILIFTGFIALGFNVFLNDIFAGVAPAKYINTVNTLLIEPPKNKIKIYPRLVINKNYTDKEELIKNLSLIDGQAFEGYAFVCDGEPRFIIDDTENLDDIINEYTSQYKTENTTITVLACKSETVNGIYNNSDKKNRQEALEALAGINVITIDSIILKETVACGIETNQDNTKKEGTVTVSCEGSDGETEIIKIIRKINGNVINEQVIDQVVVTVPVSRIETRGTKVVTGVGTGTFLRPVQGGVSSNFGMRWGKKHTGTDFSGNVGDPIKASDSGTVSFLGAAAGYGNLIIIDHKNDYETYYGHLNKAYVSEGDKIEVGEIIGEIGNTGNSTGPHLHFEIRHKGTPMDPLKYLQ